MTTQPDALELAGRLEAPWAATDEPVVKKINRLLKLGREAAAALRALQAERDDEVRRVREEARANYVMAHTRAAERDQECFRLEAALANLAAENEGLRADCIRLNNEKIDRFERAVIAEASLTEARAEMAGLREALEPFDDALGEDDEGYGDGLTVVLKWGACSDYSITLADLREARRARAAAQGETT